MLGLAIGGLIAALAKLAGGVTAGWAEARIAGEVGAELRLEVLDGIHGATSLRAPRQRDHGEAHPGANIVRLASLTTHVSDVEKGVAQGVFAELRAVLQLAPLAVLLVVLAPRLAGSAALALGAFGVLVMYARRALKRNHARAAREAEALLGAADEAVRHADLWATYGAEGRIRSHVTRLGRMIITTSSRLRARSALVSHTSEVLGALALVLTLALVGAGAIAGVDRGAIVPFAIAFFMAYKPLRELVDGRLVRARAEDALEETRESKSGRPANDARADEPAKPRATREWPLATLSVKGLVGRHGAHEPLSFVVAPGKVAAIVGPTGIGKTSLLRALLGLEAPREGTLAWGDLDLSRSGVGPSERPFAWVPQDAPVLGDTLVANVVLGVSDSNDVAPVLESDAAHASRVLADLGAASLVAALGDALLVTDRPVSGGERQWIAVARALATRLPVLVLDEPTSSLDGAAQERMLAAIAGLRGKRTVVIVTHRPEPLAIADVVIRLSPAASDGEDAQHRTRRDDDTVGSQELSIEDVGAAALESQLERPRERIDVRSAE